VQINPRTTAKYLVKMLEETCTKVSMSTVNIIMTIVMFGGKRGRLASRRISSLP
jgi:hypothetical protein